MRAQSSPTLCNPMDDGRAPSPRRSPSESRCFCPLQAFVHGQYLVLVDFVLTLALYLGGKKGTGANR